MSVDPRALEVTSPCPVDLDAEGMRGPGRSWHCGHCDKAVHVLSAMTEREVQTFLRENAGKDVCVSYARTAEGGIRFAPEPAPEPAPAIVPVASLARRQASRASAIGLGLTLAACAPHDNPRLTPRPTAQIEHQPTPITAPSFPLAPPASAAFDDMQIDGGMRIPPPIEAQIEGGLRIAPAADVPCDAPAAEPAKPHAPPRPMAERGRLRRAGL